MTSSMPRYALSLTIGALLAPLAHAQTASPDAGKQDATTLDAVIVSGTARFQGPGQARCEFFDHHRQSRTDSASGAAEHG